jgi:hypothetical protein
MSEPIKPRRQRGDGILSPDQLEFIEWLVDPRMTEWANQAEYAAAHNVAPKTLSKWKGDLKFREAWDKRLGELNVNPARIQEVLDAMHRAATATRPDTKAAQLYMQFVDRWRPTVEVVTTTTAAELTDEQLEAEYQRALESEIERRVNAGDL